MKQPDHPFKIGFLLSGSGSTLENLLSHIQYRYINATVSVVVSSRDNVYGLKRAKSWNIPHHVVPYKNYKSDLQTYSDKITEILNSHNVDLVVFGGFMSRYLIPNQYLNKVINVHPALIPAFSGHGYYGEKVHKAVIDFGAKVTGCTVHFVDNEYDNGAIIAQSVIDVHDFDTAETIQQRVQQLERQLYPKVINYFVENLIQINDRKVFILK